MTKVKNLYWLMMLPGVITAICMVWVAYFPNPMM